MVPNGSRSEPNPFIRNFPKYTVKSDRHCVLPDYQHQSIALIPNTVHSLFGFSRGAHLSINKRALGFDRPQKVVLFLLDGFGLDHFSRYEKPVKFLRHFATRGQVQTLTSTFPSTTAAALTTLHTNRMPVEHGNIEWHWHYEKANALIESLPFCIKGNDQDSLRDAGFPPEDLYSGETLYSELQSQGIESHVLVVDSFVQSVYSQQVMRGAKIHGYSHYASMFRQLANLLSKPGRAYVFVYMGQIDSKMHRFGPNSEPFIEELEKLDAQFIRFLRQSVPFDTTLLLTADHGHIGTDPETTIYLDDIPGLFDLFSRQNGRIMLPGGSPRDLFLYIKKNAIPKAKKLLEKHLPDCTILSTKQLLKEKWLGHGKTHPQLISRLGNLVILPVFGQTVWYRHPRKPRFTHRGMHGGLSIREMQVPFAALGKTGFLPAAPIPNGASILSSPPTPTGHMPFPVQTTVLDPNPDRAPERLAAALPQNTARENTAANPETPESSDRMCSTIRPNAQTVFAPPVSVDPATSNDPALSPPAVSPALAPLLPNANPHD